MSQTRSSYFPLGGGEDLKTPPLSIKPGRALLALNYDCASNGGYRKIAGYERFDGRPAPSDATFYGARFQGTTDWEAGDTVAGTILTTVSDPDENGFFVATWETQPVIVVGNIYTNGSTNAEAITVAVFTATADDAQYLEAIRASRELARARIQEVPGSGPVRCVFGFEDDVYAIRDNVGATAGAIWKDSTGGWTSVDLGSALHINTGQVEILRNDLIEGATSGATARVVAVSRISGDWGTNWEGELFLTDQVGTFTATEHIKIQGDPATAAHVVDYRVLALPAGGSYKTDEFNFFADATGNTVFIVNGVGRCLTFNGEAWAEIRTGTPVDTPTDVCPHRSYLFLGYDTGSLQFSVAGNPYLWEAGLGAGEIGVGDNITGLVSFREVLFIFSRAMVQALYGRDPDDFELRPFSRETGGLPLTQQQMGPIYFVDQRGITSLQAVQDFSNFRAEPLSFDIDSLVLPRLGLITASLINRDDNLYRLFFSDGIGITMAFRANRLVGFTRFRIPIVVNTAHTTVGTNEVERKFVGAADGFVYEMEKGTTFDGTNIKSILRLAFNAVGSPRLRKRFKKAVLELQAPANVELRLLADLSYGSPDVPSIQNDDQEIFGGGGFWDLANWSEFVWSSQPVPEMEARIDGTGQNISLFIDGDDDAGPHTISGVILSYIDRRMLR